MEHFFPQIQVKTKKKKGLHQKWNTFFPRIQVESYAQMHTRVKLLGGYIPPPPGFGTPASMPVIQCNNQKSLRD